MEIKRAGTQPSTKRPSDWFTGTVRIDPLFQAPDPAFVQGASVTFEPGARTAWHTHPLGQTLIVTGGCGWAQRAGGPVEEIRPGDVVWFSPGEKHWHGAAPTTAMTHIAIQEKKGWQSGRLDGAGNRGAVSQVNLAVERFGTTKRKWQTLYKKPSYDPFVQDLFPG
jgi:quercetin dioxygenase-like cupin family protein